MRDDEMQRWKTLDRVGYGVMHLDHEEVELDFYTDVPPRCFDEEVAEAGSRAVLQGAPEQDLDAVAGALYGQAYYLATMNGRSAEMALVAGLALEDGVVLTHGLFHTTQRAFVDGGLSVETTPIAADGLADLDLNALEKRLAAGGVAAVCLEPNNNSLFGWRLTLENAERVAALCKTHGALFLQDNARLMANFFDDELDREAMMRMTALADAFTVPCSKELLGPGGGLVAVRDLDVLRRAFIYSFTRGTHFAPAASHTVLTTGIRRMSQSARPLRRRKRQLEQLASGLRAEGIPFVEPIGGHAIYLRLDPALSEGAPLCFRALEALLYAQSGIRALIKADSRLGCPVLRLPIQLGRYRDQQLEGIPAALTRFLESTVEIPKLVPRSGAKNLHPYLTEYDLLAD